MHKGNKTAHHKFKNHAADYPKVQFFIPSSPSSPKKVKFSRTLMVGDTDDVSENEAEYASMPPTECLDQPSCDPNLEIPTTNLDLSSKDTTSPSVPAP